MTKITHSSFILLIVLLCSCAKDEQPPVSIYPIDEDVILNDVSYGQDSKQQMNVYLPKNRNSKSSKFMVLIHGGAWSTGDKDEFGLLDETAFSLLKSQFQLPTRRRR
jgi:acetyl esterase/lipase